METCKNVRWDTLLTSVLVVSLVLSGIGIFVSRHLLIWIDTPETVLTEAVRYLRIYFVGLIGVAGYSTLSGMIRSTGKF